MDEVQEQAREASGTTSGTGHVRVASTSGKFCDYSHRVVTLAPTHPPSVRPVLERYREHGRERESAGKIQHH